MCVSLISRLYIVVTTINKHCSIFGIKFNLLDTKSIKCLKIDLPKSEKKKTVSRIDLLFFKAFTISLKSLSNSVNHCHHYK